MKALKKQNGVLTVLILGIVIVVLMNLVNVYMKGKKVADKIAYSGVADYQEFKDLGPLMDSSIELKGDLFQEWRKVIQAVDHLNNVRESFQKLEISELSDLAEAFENHNSVILETADEILSAKEKLENLKINMLPDSLREKVEIVQAEFQKYSDFIDEIKGNIPAIETLLGIRYPHRYLILFQNNNESRPTGGFIGSVMVLDVNDGELTKSEVIDVYDLDGQFHDYIEPPAEIAELTPQWRLRDSNYWPDFAISGEKAAWFFQKEGGPSVDSVIAINQSILKELLEITGPIQVPGLRSEITGENYDTVLSYIIESKLDGADTPKEVLKNLVPLVQQELLKKENFLKVLEVIKSEIAQKNLLAYSRHQGVQEFFNGIKASGRMLADSQCADYLSVVTTSVSGNKSDKYIEQKLSHSTWISRDGEIQNQLAITRTHTWDNNDLWEWWDVLKKFGFTEITDVIKDVLGRGTNKSIVRVYVPKGSELLETTSVGNVAKQYDAILKKEYFMFRMEVSHGEEETVVLDYKIPFKLEYSPLATYKLYVQKQPGNINTTFEKRVSAEHQRNHKNFPESEKPEYSFPLNYDEYFSSVWGI